MNKLILTLTFCLLAGAAGAEQLTWQQLLKQPEFMPSQCTVKKAMDFQSGASIKAGQKVNVRETSPDLVVETLDGRTAFAVEVADTDILDVANTAYNSLTPEQRALTISEVLNRQELWPYKVTLKDSFDISGQRLNKGTQVYLMYVENGSLYLVPPTFNLNFDLLPEDTDFFEQARANLVKGAPGRIVEELQGKLINAQTGEAVKLDEKATPKYFVFYHAARWCPYTQKFTPGLLKVYNELIKNNPDYQLIYIPAEKSAAELQQYAKEMNFPWPAVKFGADNQMAVFPKILGRSSIPEFGVVDRYGNMIIDNMEIDRDTALQQLEGMLKQQSAKN